MIVHIVVCIKQVPETRDVAMDPEKGVLRRAEVAGKLNPFDLYALEAAVRIKEKLSGRVTAITMGPPQAEEVIRESFLMGADRGVLLSDPAFAGADTLATAFTLARGIGRLDSPELIICGVQTTEGDTGQVGPGVAEFLGLPHVSYVRAIRKATREGLVMEQDLGDQVAVVSLPYPCLITVDKGIGQPRLPSFRRFLETKDYPVITWGYKELSGGDEVYFGLEGSPTQVERIFPPKVEREHVVFTDGDLARQLYQKLLELKFVG